MATIAESNTKQTHSDKSKQVTGRGTDLASTNQTHTDVAKTKCKRSSARLTWLVLNQITVILSCGAQGSLSSERT